MSNGQTPSWASGPGEEPAQKQSFVQKAEQTAGRFLGGVGSVPMSFLKEYLEAASALTGHKPQAPAAIEKAAQAPKGVAGGLGQLAGGIGAFEALPSEALGEMVPGAGKAARYARQAVKGATGSVLGGGGAASGAIGGAASEALPGGTEAKLATKGSKAGLESYIHASGMTAKEMLSGALKNARKQVGNLAQQVSSKVDAAEPEGAIDAAKITAGAENAWKRIFAVAKKYPSEIDALFSEPGAAPQDAERQLLGRASVFRGRAGIDVKEFLRTADPQIRERLMREMGTEGEDTGISGASKWSFEQAKQLRTQVGRALSRTGELGDSGARRDMRAALSHIYAALSGEMKAAASRNGADAEYSAYNDLENFIDRKLLARDRPLSKILSSKVTRGKTVLSLLDKGEESSDSTINALEKYGLDKPKIQEFRKNFSKFKKFLSSGGGFYGIISSARQYPIGTIGGLALAKSLLPGMGYLPYIGGVIAGSQGEKAVRQRLSAMAARKMITPEMLEILQKELGPSTPVP